MSSRRSSSEAAWSFWVQGALLLLARPRLWAVGLRQVRRLARPRWWRTPPFLPVPDRDYVRFRLETQYGTDGRPDPQDLVEYLEWCAEMEATRPARRRR